MDNILHLDTTTSTNDEMQALYQREGENLPEGMFIYADEQTKGRGQVGNHWESEKGKNLLCTALIYPDFVSADKQFIITQMGALAVTDFLSLIGIKDATVKWPNDVYVADKKISGTLNEAMLMGHTIGYVMLGVGVNLNQTAFTSYAPNPVSAQQISGHDYEVDRCAVLFRQCLMKRYMQLVNGDIDGIRTDYMARLYRKEGYYWYEDEHGACFEATISEILHSGELVLKLKTGELRSFLFKQVKFVL